VVHDIMGTRMAYEFYIPTRIIFAAGGLSQLPGVAREWGRKPLLVTGRGSMRRLGITSRIVDDLKKEGLRVTPFEKVEPNPRTTTIDDAAQVFRGRKLDLIIALGGGSVMDAAKGVAMAVSGTKPVWYYIEKQAQPGDDVPPIIAIPTVAASGSESNCGAVITNWATHEKMVLHHKSLYPVVSIVDPELTLSLPLKQTLQGVVDIFCHLLEPYLTDTGKSPLTDGIRETAMKIVVDNSSSIKTNLNNIEVRTQLSWASTIACSAFASLGGGGGGMSLHGIEHAISAHSDAAHGDGLAALLPAWMEYTQPVVSERFRQLGEKVFGDKDLIGSTRNWLKDIGMDIHLRDIGIDRGQLSQIAATVQKTAGWITEHPGGMTRINITEIYESAY
jgi:alcohol dehydrogenase YqhD (iron-dependent ADH family)